MANSGNPVLDIIGQVAKSTPASNSPLASPKAAPNYGSGVSINKPAPAKTVPISKFIGSSGKK